MKFTPADYKQQWSLVRRIDDVLGPDPAVTTGPDIAEAEETTE